MEPALDRLPLRMLKICQLAFDFVMAAVCFFLLLSVFFRISNPAVVGVCKERRTSNRCHGANAFWQYDGICIDAHDKTTCHVPDTWRFFFRLVVAVDQRLNSSGTIPIDSLWIRGAGPKLSWEKSTKMTKVQEGHWSLDIKYVYDSNALLCLQKSRCSLNQRALEFRVYRDEHGMDGMLGPNIYIPLPISGSNYGHPEFSPPLAFAYPWFDGKQVMKKGYWFENPLHFITHTVKGIKVTVYYPPSFQHNLFKRYPVVITFGQRDTAILLGPLLESMFIYEHSIEEAFIIVVHAMHPAPFCQFNPFTVLEADPKISGGNNVFKCRSKLDLGCAKCLTCFSPERAELCDANELRHQMERCGAQKLLCGSYGDAFLDNIENLVIPEMSVRTLGRIMVDFPKDRISIIGLDGTGLLACYAALSRPLVYKNAGCMSASFHWPFRSLEVMESREDQGIGMLLKEVVERMKIRKEFQLLHATQKYYIDVGEFDNDYMPIIQEHNYSDWVVEQLQSQLGVDKENILYYRNIRWAGNSVFILRRDGDIRLLNRIKLPLLFFLKPKGGLNATHPRSPVVKRKDYVKRSDKITPVTANRTASITSKKPEVNCRDLIRNADSKRVSVPTFLLSIGELLFSQIVMGSLLTTTQFFQQATFEVINIRP